MTKHFSNFQQSNNVNSSSFSCFVALVVMTNLLFSTAWATSQKASTQPQKITPPANTNTKNMNFAGATWTFHSDAYYLYNMNTPKNQNDGSVGFGQNGYRAYDTTHNSFELNDIGTTVLREFDNFSVFAQVDFGDAADAFNGVGAGRNVTQAYASLRLPQLQGWILDIGKFNSHMGYETFLAKDNWNYSRSLTFIYGTPNWHVGARAIAPTQGPLQMTFLVLNGTPQEMKDNNKSKTLGAQLKYVMSPQMKFTYNGVIGPEKTDNNSDYSATHNVIAELEFESRFKLAAEFTNGSESNDSSPNNTVSVNDDESVWTSFALYGHMMLTDTMYVSPRYELFKAKERDGALSLAQGGTLKDETVNSVTVTLGQTLNENMSARYEIRHDSSDFDQAFAEDSGIGNDNRTDKQLTFAAALLLNF